jgi:hypothetical protein
MFRSFGLLLAALLVAIPGYAHDEQEQTLDPHSATPGVHLELIELPRAESSAAVMYRLRVTGVSRDIFFNVWTQDFGAMFYMVASGLWLDESGNVVSSGPQAAFAWLDASGKVISSRPMKAEPHSPLTIRPGPHPQGAAWSVALISVDRAVRAFAWVIPRPIISRSGPCMVQLELVSYRGDRFVA